MTLGSCRTALEVDMKCSNWAVCFSHPGLQHPGTDDCWPADLAWVFLPTSLLHFTERWTYLSILLFSCYFKVNETCPDYSVVWWVAGVPDSKHDVYMCHAPQGTDSPIPVFLDSQKFPGPHTQNAGGHLWELLKTANNSNPIAGPLWRNRYVSPWGCGISVLSEVTVDMASSFGENKIFLARPAHPVGHVISSVFSVLGKRESETWIWSQLCHIYSGISSKPHSLSGPWLPPLRKWRRNLHGDPQGSFEC